MTTPLTNETTSVGATIIEDALNKVPKISLNKDGTPRKVREARPVTLEIFTNNVKSAADAALIFNKWRDYDLSTLDPEIAEVIIEKRESASRKMNVARGNVGSAIRSLSRALVVKDAEKYAELISAVEKFFPVSKEDASTLFADISDDFDSESN